MTPETYGDRLQFAMDHAKPPVTRAELAKKLGVTPQAVGMVIRGETGSFDAANHTKAFRFLNCDPLWLATGKGKAPTAGTNVRSVMIASEAAAPADAWEWPLVGIDPERYRQLPSNWRRQVTAYAQGVVDAYELSNDSRGKRPAAG